jgi:hypothetical protein
MLLLLELLAQGIGQQPHLNGVVRFFFKQPWLARAG